MRRLHLAAAIAALAIGSTTAPAEPGHNIGVGTGRAVDGVAEDDLTVLKAFPDIAKSAIRRAYALTES